MVLWPWVGCLLGCLTTNPSRSMPCMPLRRRNEALERWCARGQSCVALPVRVCAVWFECIISRFAAGIRIVMLMANEARSTCQNPGERLHAGPD